MKSILLLLSLLMVGALRAQPRVISNENFKKSGQSIARLDKTYSGRFTGVTLDQLGESVRTEVKQLVAQKDLSNLIISLHVYLSESGKVDWVIYQVVADQEIRNPVQQLLDTKLAGKLQGWQIKGLQGKKFSFMTLVRMGNPPIVRTERKGDSLLSSLDEARTTLDTLGIKALHFHQLKLTEVPYDIIYRFPNLELLDLHSNALTSLDLDLSRLPGLKNLDLHANQLRAESIHLTKNRSLQFLNLHSNNLTDVPGGVRNCKRLASLWIGGNKALALTNQSFRKLRRLTDMNLYGCQLKALPGGLRKLRRLEVLDLYYNEFAELPDALTRLKRLRQLAISNNQLVRLPARIDRLRRLEVLYAHHNRLSTLPERTARLEHLQLLDIGYNWYRKFPEEIVALTSLRELDISANELMNFPLLLSEMQTLEKLHMRGNPFLTGEQESVYLPLIKKLEQNPAEVYY